MRYEAMRLLQFMFSLCLILGAFLGGLYVGWRRWGRPGPADHSAPDRAARRDSAAEYGAELHTTGAHRRDLFAPETGTEPSAAEEPIDLRVAPAPSRLGLPPGTTSIEAR